MAKRKKANKANTKRVSRTGKKVSRKEKQKKNRGLQIIGNLLILAGLFILVFTFGPVAKEEARYQIDRALDVTYSTDPQVAGGVKRLTPPNTEFSVVIPKLGAAAPVVKDVDATDPQKYLPALFRGVAHAQGTAYPGQEGNVYLFAHSTDAFYNVGRYNAVFYLLGKLRPTDTVELFYKGEKITYQVTGVHIVEADDIKYLGKIRQGKTLTLQTCYPPGTTLKRLVVTAEQI